MAFFYGMQRWRCSSHASQRLERGESHCNNEFQRRADGSRQGTELYETKGTTTDPVLGCVASTSGTYGRERAATGRQRAGSTAQRSSGYYSCTVYLNTAARCWALADARWRTHNASSCSIVGIWSRTCFAMYPVFGTRQSGRRRGWYRCLNIFSRFFGSLMYSMHSVSKLVIAAVS
jgi:hypothetical protein